MRLPFCLFTAHHCSRVRDRNRNRGRGRQIRSTHVHAPALHSARRHLREQARPGQAAYYLIRGALQNITKSFAI